MVMAPSNSSRLAGKKKSSVRLDCHFEITILNNYFENDNMIFFEIVTLK